MTACAKFGKDPISVSDPSGGVTLTSKYFPIFFFYPGSSSRAQVAPIDVYRRMTAQNACFDGKKCL